jgi:ABC-type multidrug transport system fused ATPase/permease subunit
VKEVWRTLRVLLPLLPVDARSYLVRYITISSLLTVLDIGAVMLLALCLNPMMRGAPIAMPLIGTIGPDRYVWVIAFVSALILVKTLLSLLQNWFATRRFSQFELAIGERLLSAYIKAPWTERLKRTSAQLVRLGDVGVAASINGFLLPLVGLPALITSFLVIVAIIVVAQPLTALITVVYLGLIMLLVTRLVSPRSVAAGKTARDYGLKINSLMTDMVTALKEITLRGKADEVARVVQENRKHASLARSNINFYGTTPRMVLDTSLVGGFLLVGALGYVTEGISAGISAIALFAVAGFRLIPTLTGIQGIITTTTSNVAQVKAAITDIDAAQGYLERAEKVGHEPIAGTPRVLHLTNVEYHYPDHEKPAVSHIDLEIPMGSTIALVGSSGAGKTTLVDILLGLLVPTSGRIAIDGQNLEDVLADWRSRVGYVPQEVALFDGTVAQNVALSWEDDQIDRAQVEAVLKKAQLWDVIMTRPGGLDSRVGDRGMSLSGGQRQRLGIARALYSDPLVLIMDEATSALDTKTESDVAFAIRQLKGEITVISVAHRLSTIRDNDLVCYMQDGTIHDRGTFDELVARVPNFAEQAQLAGLA